MLAAWRQDESGGRPGIYPSEMSALGIEELRLPGCFNSGTSEVAQGWNNRHEASEVPGCVWLEEGLKRDRVSSALRIMRGVRV